MNDELIQYVYTRNGKKLIGCVIAKRLQSDRVFVTGGLCSKRDVFSKSDAYELARNRVTALGNGRACPVPYSLKFHIANMEARAGKYFKTENITSSVLKSPMPKDKNDKLPVAVLAT